MFFLQYMKCSTGKLMVLSPTQEYGLEVGSFFYVWNISNFVEIFVFHFLLFCCKKKHLFGPVF